MLNDKLIIEMSCNYVYRLDELLDETSDLNKLFKINYPSVNIVDVQEYYNRSNLIAICIQDRKSMDVAIIFQGSTTITNWKTDNFNNFLNKDVEAYDAALAYVKELEDKDYRITYVAGNSLGGGCAQYVGLYYQNIKAICINAAPLSNNKSLEMSNRLVNTDNIKHIRVSSDPLYRTVMLDKNRFESGYLGQVYTIKRSLYGSFDYYNCIELAHRGSIVFPAEMLKKTYDINGFADLNKIEDKRTYNEIVQLIKAPTLAEFMSFDLVSNNIDTQEQFNIDTIINNFNTRIEELEKSILEYHIPNIELCIGDEFVNINDSISDKLKEILKSSLFQITKQDEKLFDNVYFVIEKTSNYFYKQIAKSINKISTYQVPDATAKDYEKIINDVSVNKICCNIIIESMEKINNELSDYEKFKITNFFNSSTIPNFDYSASVWSQNYQAIIFDEIDEAIHTAVLDNKSFITQIEKMINTALKAIKVTMQIPFINSDDKAISSDDIDYVIDNYNISKIINRSLKIYKEDFYETILSKSFLYCYLVNIRCINEQIALLIKSLDNLEQYILNENKKKNKRLLKMIKDTKTYAQKLSAYNEKNMILK